MWETKPSDSALDIYYETSLTGLVSELNTQLDVGSTGPTSIALSNSTFSEGFTSAQNPLLIGNLSASDVSNNPLGSATFTLLSIKDALNNPVNPHPFAITNNALNVTNGGFYHDINGESFTVRVRAQVANAEPHDQDLTITTSNVAPSFSSSLQTQINFVHFSVADPSAPGGSSVGSLDISYNAKNGSGDSTRDDIGLVYSIQSVHLKTLANGNAVSPPQLVWEINNNSYATTDNPFVLNGTELQNRAYFAVSEINKVFTVKVRVTDSGGLHADHNIDITISRLTLANYLESVNFNGLCTPSTTTLYLTKGAASSSGAVEVGDFVYVDLNGTITAYSGHVILSTSSANGDGFYAKTIGGNPGEVMTINERDCSVGAGGGSGGSGGGPPGGEF